MAYTLVVVTVFATNTLFRLRVPATRVVTFAKFKLEIPLLVRDATFNVERFEVPRALILVVVTVFATTRFENEGVPNAVRVPMFAVTKFAKEVTIRFVTLANAVFEVPDTETFVAVTVFETTRFGNTGVPVVVRVEIFATERFAVFVSTRFDIFARARFEVPETKTLVAVTALETTRLGNTGVPVVVRVEIFATERFAVFVSTRFDIFARARFEVPETETFVTVTALETTRFGKTGVPVVVRVAIFAAERFAVFVSTRFDIFARARFESPLTNTLVTLAVVAFTVVAMTFVVLTALDTNILETLAIIIGFVKLKDPIFAVTRLEFPLTDIFVVVTVLDTTRFGKTGVPVVIRFSTLAVAIFEVPETETFVTMTALETTRLGNTGVPVVVRVEIFATARFASPLATRLVRLAVVTFSVPVRIFVVLTALETTRFGKTGVPVVVRVAIFAVERFEFPVELRVDTFTKERFAVFVSTRFDIFARARFEVPETVTFVTVTALETTRLGKTGVPVVVRVAIFAAERFAVFVSTRFDIFARARFEVPETVTLVAVTALETTRLGNTGVPVVVKVAIFATARFAVPLATRLVRLAVVAFSVPARIFVVLTELDTTRLGKTGVPVVVRMETFATARFASPLATRLVRLAVVTFSVPARIFVVLTELETTRLGNTGVPVAVSDSTFTVAMFATPTLDRVEIFAEEILDVPLITMPVTLAVVTFSVPAKTLVVLTELETTRLGNTGVSVVVRVAMFATARFATPVLVRVVTLPEAKLAEPAKTLVVLTELDTTRLGNTGVSVVVRVAMFAAARFATPVLVRVATFNVARLAVPLIDTFVTVTVLETTRFGNTGVPEVVNVVMLAIVRLDVPVTRTELEHTMSYRVVRAVTTKLSTFIVCDTYTLPVTSTSVSERTGVSTMALNRHWPVPMMCRAGWSFKAVNRATASFGVPVACVTLRAGPAP